MPEIKDQIESIDDSGLTKPIEIDDLKEKSGQVVQMEGAIRFTR